MTVTSLRLRGGGSSGGSTDDELEPYVLPPSDDDDDVLEDNDEVSNEAEEDASQGGIDSPDQPTPELIRKQRATMRENADVFERIGLPGKPPC